MDGFTSASASTSKARKAATRSAQLLPTQPKAAAAAPFGSAADEDEDMGDLERLPLAPAPSSSKGKGKQRRSHDDGDDDDAIMIDSGALPTAPTTTQAQAATTELSFPAVSHESNVGLTQRRKVTIPPHRMTPLKRDWIKIYTPLVEECGLQVRMNPQKRYIEMKTSKHTKTTSALSRAADFLNAYTLGFAADDAIAMLRLEDLYIETFEVKDVKNLQGDHLSRAIGRIAGHQGKTRIIIENASRTRVVLADSRVHILGTYQNIKIARDAICMLILGSPPGKIYAGLRKVAARSRERF